MTTLSHTQTHPRAALAAHWRISLEDGCWIVDVFNPRFSGHSTHGSYYTLGSATQCVQTWASVGDTVEVFAPDDRADGYTGTVTEYPGGQSPVSRKVVHSSIGAAPSAR